MVPYWVAIIDGVGFGSLFLTLVLAEADVCGVGADGGDGVDVQLLEKVEGAEAFAGDELDL